MLNFIKAKHSTSKIKYKRFEIAKKMNQSSSNVENYNIKHITVADLKMLFYFYDNYFFKNWFKRDFKGKIEFSISKRMTRSAGQINYSRKLDELKEEDMKFVIQMSYDFFLRYDELNGDKVVNGIKTKNNLEAFQLVFEHELIHLIELLSYKKTNCNNPRFKSIAHSLFAHIKSTHSLPTYKDIAYYKYNLKIGDIVSFSFKNRVHLGKISKITKRATVMVKDKKGEFVDKLGVRYSKYYIPIEELEKVEFTTND